MLLSAVFLLGRRGYRSALFAIELGLRRLYEVRSVDLLGGCEESKDILIDPAVNALRLDPVPEIRGVQDPPYVFRSLDLGGWDIDRTGDEGKIDVRAAALDDL